MSPEGATLSACHGCKPVGLRPPDAEKTPSASSAFKTCHRAQAHPDPSNATDILWHTAQAILEHGLTRDMLPLRLLGVWCHAIDRRTGQPAQPV
jgi:hypothetical protein